MKQSDPENSLKAQFVIFRCQKYVKKKVHRNGRTTLPRAFKDCPRSLCFPVLWNRTEERGNKYFKKEGASWVKGWMP